MRVRHSPSRGTRGTGPCASNGTQSGIGLVEVMVALAIVVFVAVVTANIQVTALVGTRSSGLHLSLDRLSGEMIETLRAHAERAGAGEFDRDDATDDATDDSDDDRNDDADGPDDDSDDDSDGDDEPGPSADWHRRVVEAIRGAGTVIACDTRFCRIEINWSEEIDGTTRRQRFRTGTPL